MPFTPYHFGPALFLKGFFRFPFCLNAFALSQVFIDLESVYFLIQNTCPLHRFFHTFLGATIIILVTTLIMRCVRGGCNMFFSWKPIIIGSVFGGYSHIFLDSIMHTDMIPFFPISISNPILHFCSVSLLHFGCVISGILGVIGITFFWGRHYL